jgi:flagellar protein FlaF
MGFSVSGAAAIIFASMFVAFGMWYTAAANGFERVADAETEQTDGTLEQRNTHVEITTASYDNGTDTLTVAAVNRGASQLSLSGTDLLVDGRYVEGWQTPATVESNGVTDLWLAEETLTISLSRASQPDRVKVVTASGVADTAEVTAV